MVVRLAKIPVILVSGKIGAGKTTFSSLIVEVAKLNGIRAEKVSFARKLKELAIEMGWNGKKDEKGRRLLQSLGQVGREYDINVWVKFAIDDMMSNHTEFLVIDDWRFTNEYDYFKTLNIAFPIKVRVIRDIPLIYGIPSIDNDISETALPEDYNYYDDILFNSGTVEQLKFDASRLFYNTIRLDKLKWE